MWHLLIISPPHIWGSRLVGFVRIGGVYTHFSKNQHAGPKGRHKINSETIRIKQSLTLVQLLLIINSPKTVTKPSRTVPEPSQNRPKTGFIVSSLPNIGTEPVHNRQNRYRTGTEPVLSFHIVPKSIQNRFYRLVSSQNRYRNGLIDSSRLVSSLLKTVS